MMISAEREETTVYLRGYLLVATTHPQESQHLQQQHTDLDLVSVRKGSEGKERGVSVVPSLASRTVCV